MSKRQRRPTSSPSTTAAKRQPDKTSGPMPTAASRPTQLPSTPQKAPRTSALPAPERLSVAAWFHRAWETLRAEQLQMPLSIFVGSRLALFALVLLFVGLFPIAADKKPDFIKAFSTWDGGWYLTIAEKGYSWSGLQTQSNVAFFPLYPLLGKIVGFVLGSPRWGLFVVANVSFAFFLVYLYKLAFMDFDDGTAGRAVLYVALFPLAFIFSSMYTESTMLALTVAAFYYARRGKWPAAIALAWLATLTRLAGIVILFPLAWEFYKQRGIRWQALSLAIIPTGTILYAAYVWSLTGSPLSFTTVTSEAWNRHFTWPWETLRIAFTVVTRNPLQAYVTSIAIVDTALIVLFLGLSIAGIRWMPPAYWLYAVPAALLAISNTLSPTAGLPTASLGRYLMAVFPAYILLGKAGRNPYVHHTVVFMFAILLGILSIYFFSTIWVA